MYLLSMSLEHEQSWLNNSSSLSSTTLVKPVKKHYTHDYHTHDHYARLASLVILVERNLDTNSVVCLLKSSSYPTML